MTQFQRLSDTSGGLILERDEAAIVTTDDGEGLALYLPEKPGDAQVPKMIKFLAAVLIRGEYEPGFVEEQVAWMDKTMKKERN